MLIFAYGSLTLCRQAKDKEKKEIQERLIYHAIVTVYVGRKIEKNIKNISQATAYRHNNQRNITIHHQVC